MSTVRRLPCSLCAYSATTADNLKKHNRIHNEEKPFMCYQCDFSTSNSGNLNGTSDLAAVRSHSSVKCVTIFFSHSFDLNSIYLFTVGRNPSCVISVSTQPQNMVIWRSTSGFTVERSPSNVRSVINYFHNQLIWTATCLLTVGRNHSGVSSVSSHVPHQVT